MTTNNERDKELVARHLDGDRDAFTEIYTDYFKRVRFEIGKVIFDFNDVPDAEQVFWMHIASRLDRWDETRGSLANFLLKSAKNKAIDWYREATSSEHKGLGPNEKVVSSDAINEKVSAEVGVLGFDELDAADRYGPGVMSDGHFRNGEPIMTVNHSDLVNELIVDETRERIAAVIRDQKPKYIPALLEVVDAGYERGALRAAAAKYGLNEQSFYSAWRVFETQIKSLLNEENDNDQ